MNDVVITSERLKELEDTEEVYQSLHRDYVTLKANERVLRTEVNVLRVELKNANNEIKRLDGHGKH